MKKIILFVLLSIFVTTAYANDGDLDTSFGGGIVTDNFGGSFGIFTRSVKIQTDGKILTGSAVLGADFQNYDFGILRYNTDGTLDTTFGAGGRQIVDVDGGSENLPTVLLQTDGKIIIVGQRIITGQSVRGIVLVRLNANGSFDTSFGANGKVITTFDSANKVAANLQMDGKIVVAGNWSGSSFSVARFNADGTLDNSFGTSGVVQNNITGNTGISYAVAFQTDGKILVGGLITNSPSNTGDFIVFRYNANGAVDTNFNGVGYSRVDFNNMRDAAQSLAVQPDGKIIAAGLATIASNIGNVFGIARFNSDGSLDSNFGTNGKVAALPVNAFIDQINDRYPLILQPNGKIVVGRTRFINDNANSGKQSNIARFNADGSLDMTFGTGGQIATTQLATLGDLALQTDGKIVATGSGLNNGSAVTARYLNTAGSAPVNNPALRVADFDGDGKTDASVFRSGTWFINPSSSPSFAPNSFYGVNFGLTTDKLAPADFDGDGKTDIAVWREGAFGYFYILNSSNNTFRAAQFGTIGDDPIVVGDWDGDGKADPAVYRGGAAGGQSLFFYRPSSQPAVDFETVYWGAGGDQAVRGDFDGDRRIDAAVFRPSNGVWYIRQSSNNQAFYKQFGAATDRRVSGDFDGDGKTDVAIYRDGLWAVLQSSNNGQTYRQFGATTDAVAAGDYDGDGKTDFAVFRDGVYYILNNANSQTSVRQFGAANDKPVASAFVR
ncbi:MAG: FG-GAP-like repeat-containing protein [Pyrinomonadaceae bacterium]